MHANTQNMVYELDNTRLRGVGKRRAMEQWLYEGHLENPYKKGTPEHDGFALVSGEIESQQMADEQMRGYC